MLRSSVSSRWVLGLALALIVGAGLPLGAAALWSGSEASRAPRTQVASASEPAEPTASGPAAPSGKREMPQAKPTASTESPAATRLTLDEVKAIALKAAPGRIVDIDKDHEPTGLRYDLEILRSDRTSTDVEVDATTGKVTSIDHDDDRDDDRDDDLD